MSRTRALLIILTLTLSQLCWIFPEGFAASAQSHDTDLFRSGNQAAQVARFDEALHLWSQALASKHLHTDAALTTDLVIKMAAAYRSIGQITPAIELLQDQLQTIETQTLPLLSARLHLALASLLPLPSKRFEAFRQLQKANALAQSATERETETEAEFKSDQLHARILGVRGDLLAASGLHASALGLYSKCLTTLPGSDRSLYRANTHIKRGTALRLHGRELSEVANEARKAHQLLRELPVSHEQIFVWLRLGKLYQELETLSKTPTSSDHSQTLDAYQTALQFAQASSNPLATSYALGYLAEAYHDLGRHQDALTNARRAVFFAQLAEAPQALYRWEWLSARQFKILDEPQLAIAAYRRSIVVLQSIQHECAAAYLHRDGTTSFKDSVGGVFYELATLLLKQITPQENSEPLLREVQKTVEDLKLAELEDYFQDECLHLLRSKRISLSTADASAAVLYFIQLPAELFVLIDRNEKLSAIRCAIPRAEYAAVTSEFHTLISQAPQTHEAIGKVKEVGEKIYRRIFQPLEPHLKGIETLVIVADNSAKRIPLEALWDGKSFLIERFSTTISPGLTMTDPHKVSLADASFLACALIERDELISAKTNLATIRRIDSKATILQDAEFTKPNIASAFQTSQFNIIHFGTHGKLNRVGGESVLEAYDGTITLELLERWIRPRQFRGTPIELLVMASCESADGADLGFAGLALRSGARTAVGSLWPVDDEATGMLINAFYQHLTGQQTHRAAAMKQAKRALIQSDRFTHPFYWAAHQIVGNWL